MHEVVAISKISTRSAQDCATFLWDLEFPFLAFGGESLRVGEQDRRISLRGDYPNRVAYRRGSLCMESVPEKLI